jgi:hypothetical protein
MFGVLYIAFVFFGWLALAAYTKKTKRFLWKEFLAMCSIPIIGLIGLIVFLGTGALWAFFTGVVLGPVAEWLAGWFYCKINGSHLWIYERLPWRGRFTSYLTLPFWGAFFVAIWAAVQKF